MQNVLFVGIGGMGMGPLAIYLKETGANVIGYDDSLSYEMRSLLESQGIKIFEKVELPREDCDMIVFSNAIKKDHVIIQKAEKMGIPVMRRGEFLANTIQNKRLVAIVGSHGKTTTTAYLIHFLKQNNVNFSYILGGLFRSTFENLSHGKFLGDKTLNLRSLDQKTADSSKLSSKNTYLPAHFDSKSSWIVAEIDESDGSIESFSPAITLMSNFDWDHPDFYKSEDALFETFERLLKRTEIASVLPEDSENSRVFGKMSIRLTNKLYSFGEKGDFSGFSSQKENKWYLNLQGLFAKQEIQLRDYPGFNVKNITLALAGAQLILSKEENFTNLVDSKVINNFPGVNRRQDILYKSDKLVVLADYAHHPSEIRALLDYSKQSLPGKQMVVFQPHRYSRTRCFANAFAEVLKQADQVVLLDVYAASEQPISEGTVSSLFSAFNGWENVITQKKEEVSQYLLLELFSEKVTILFVGAGDIDKLAKSFVQMYENFILKRLTFNLSDNCLFSENEILSSKTTLKIGGKARFYAEPDTMNDLLVLVRKAKFLGIPFFVLGGGSNVLVPDEGFDGLVIRLNRNYWTNKVVIDDSSIQVGSGTRLKDLCRWAVENNLSGFEFLEGIPGTLGGAVYMNAGAMGTWMSNIIDSVDAIESNGELRNFTISELTYKYRECVELKDAIIVRATLKAAKVAQNTEIINKIESFASKRRSSQPVGLSSGCFFKNPENEKAGKIIDELGFKGTKIGDAIVSEKHANFIINQGNASSQDILKLAKNIHQKALERGIKLEPEVKLLGKDWDSHFEV